MKLVRKRYLKNHDSYKDDLHFVKDLLLGKIKVNIIIESLKKRLLSEKSDKHKRKLLCCRGTLFCYSITFYREE